MDIFEAEMARRFVVAVEKIANALDRKDEPQTIRCPKCGRSDYIREFGKDFSVTAEEAGFKYKCINCNTYIEPQSDRKTENSSEKPNNCEPKICDTCRYYNSNIPCGSNPSACKEADKFAEEFVDGLKKLKLKVEPQTEYDKGLQLFADILFDKEKSEQFLKECKAMGIEPQTERGE